MRSPTVHNIISILAVASMAGIGTLIRVGLVFLCEDFTLAHSLIPNIVGCFIMGFHEGFSKSHSSRYIKIAIGTGLTGSITTFSTFNYEIIILIISPKPQFGIYIAVIAATFIGGIFMYFIAEMIALFLFQKVIQKQSSSVLNNKENPKKADNPQQNNKTSNETEILKLKQLETDTNDIEMTTISKINEKDDKENDQFSNNKLNKKDVRLIIQWIFILILMYCICIPISFLFTDVLYLSLLFAPFGALLRLFLGKTFNDKTNIPIGTLIANVFGSLLFTLLFVFGGQSDDILWKYTDFGYGALLTGFCGCLTTVSSFVHEKFKLKRSAAMRKKNKLETEVLACEHELATYKESVIYFFITLIISQILSAIVMSIDIFTDLIYKD